VRLPDHIPISAAALAEIARRHGVSNSEPFTVLPENGIFNAHYVLGSDLVLRVPRQHPQHFAALRREAIAVPVARNMGVCAPELVSVDDTCEILPRPFAIYGRVHGQTLEMIIELMDSPRDRPLEAMRFAPELIRGESVRTRSGSHSRGRQVVEEPSMSGPQPPAASVLELMEDVATRVEALDPRGQPWLVESDGRRAVLRRLPFSSGLDDVAWLHQFLDGLARSGFPAPRPLRLLAGASFVVLGDAIWETVSFLPGRRLNWDPPVPVDSAGALLARFHVASLAMSLPEQRPGALPMEACWPASEASLARRFQRDLNNIGYFSAARCVVHGDATPANMVVDGRIAEVSGLIDFVRAHRATRVGHQLCLVGRRPDRAARRSAGCGSHPRLCCRLSSRAPARRLRGARHTG
jgi:Phosphotransferase enzyme family